VCDLGGGFGALVWLHHRAFGAVTLIGSWAFTLFFSLLLLGLWPIDIFFVANL
jgi:hypothetical protein